MWEEREKDQDHALNLLVRNVKSKTESNKKPKGRRQVGGMSQWKQSGNCSEGQ